MFRWLTRLLTNLNNHYVSAENLNHIRRIECNQGWTDAPRWWLDSEIQERQKIRDERAAKAREQLNSTGRYL